MFSDELAKRYIEDIVYFRMKDNPNYRCTQDIEVERLAFLLKSKMHLDTLSEYWIKSHMSTFSNWPKDKEIIKLYLRMLFLELFKFDVPTKEALAYFKHIQENIIKSNIISFTDIEKVLTESFLFLEKSNKNPKKWLIHYFNIIPPVNEGLRLYYGLGKTPFGYYNKALEWKELLEDKNKNFGFEEILIAGSFLLDYTDEHLKLSSHDGFLNLMTEEIYTKYSPSEWENIFNIYEPYGDIIYNDITSLTLNVFEKIKINQVDYTIQQDENERLYINVYRNDKNIKAFLSKEMYNWTSKVLEDCSNEISITFSDQGGNEWANLYPHTDIVKETKSILKSYILERFQIYRPILDELVIGYNYDSHDELKKLIYYIINSACDPCFCGEKNPFEWILKLKNFGEWEYNENPTEEFLERLSRLTDEMRNYVCNNKGSYSQFPNITYQ